MSAAAKLKPWVPPVALNMLKRLLRRRNAVEFDRGYASWAAARADAAGYDADEILQRVIGATQKVTCGEAPYERDSVLFDEVQYSWPLLACLLQVALERGSLRVVDFGGSLGTTWRQNQRFLGRLNLEKRWTVVEQRKFVEAGMAQFETPELGFKYSIADACSTGVDVVLFCCSLCYVPDPEVFVAEATNAGTPYILVDRLPMTTGTRDEFMLQTVREPIYPASYPIRVFAEDSVFNHLFRDWRVIERWRCDLSPDPSTPYHGFFMERR